MGKDGRKPDLRMCVWNLPPNTLQKESESQGLREGIQAKIKSSHCMICINEKKVQSTVGDARVGRGSARSILQGPGVAASGPRLLPNGCCPWGQTEGSRTETGMCGAEAGIVCCLGGAAAPHVCSGVPLGSDCLAHGWRSGLRTRQEPGARTWAWGPPTPFLLGWTGRDCSPLHTSPSTWLVFQVLVQERTGGGHLYVLGRPPGSFLQHGWNLGSGGAGCEGTVGGGPRGPREALGVGSR